MTHDAAVERLARELREEDRLTTMDDGTDWHEISRFILRRFVRKSGLFPPGMTAGDLRTALMDTGSPMTLGNRLRIKRLVAAHLLALLEPDATGEGGEKGKR